MRMTQDNYVERDIFFRIGASGSMAPGRQSISHSLRHFCPTTTPTLIAVSPLQYPAMLDHRSVHLPQFALYNGICGPLLIKGLFSPSLFDLVIPSSTPNLIPNHPSCTTYPIHIASTRCGHVLGGDIYYRGAGIEWIGDWKYHTPHHLILAHVGRQRKWG